MTAGERVFVFMILGMLFGGFVGQTIGTMVNREHAYKQFQHACSTVSGKIVDGDYRDECDVNGKAVLFRG